MPDSKTKPSVGPYSLCAKDLSFTWKKWGGSCMKDFPVGRVLGCLPISLLTEKDLFTPIKWKFVLQPYIDQ